MDPRLLRYYGRELQHVREMGAEFSREFPKIASRLGLEGLECADPYVERLLEGFAFIAARVQLKIDEEFPRFTQHLLEIVYPHYLAPTPAMGIAQFEPDPNEAGLASGFEVPRGTALHGKIGRDAATQCEFTTSRDLVIWPLEIADARYYGSASSLAQQGIAPPRSAAAGLKLVIRTTAGVDLSALQIEDLPLYLAGADELPMRLHEHVLVNGHDVLVRAASADRAGLSLGPNAIQRLGFDEGDQLLPYDSRSFTGYRLLHEYFACPQRFLSFGLSGIGRAIRRLTGQELEVYIFLDRADPTLEGAVTAENFRLFCVPIVNLFPKRADRIQIVPGATEYHVVADRTRPMDFEVMAITRVDGFAGSAEPQQVFSPFYSISEQTWSDAQNSYYTLQRRPRLLSSRQRQKGSRSSYIGSEVFLSIVDAKQAPFSPDLKQLGVMTLCTNRDLPLLLPTGKGETDFTLEIGGPVVSVRCISGPTRPRQPIAAGETAWRLISQLSLSYLSLVQGEDEQNAGSLREMLMLYCDPNDAATHRQIEGIQAVSVQPLIERIPCAGPIAFGRGLEIMLTCDDTAFEGTRAFLLASVLEEFFSRYVSLNSFTETVLHSVQRGEVKRWPPRIGRRQLL
jgi:type VI secretion system protein ImpG